VYSGVRKNILGCSGSSQCKSLRNAAIGYLPCSKNILPVAAGYTLNVSRQCNEVSQSPCHSQWRSQPTILGRAYYFDFKRATLFGLAHRFSKHKTTRYARIFLGHGLFSSPWLHLWP